jgi:flagellin
MTVINSNINALKAQSSLTANQRQMDTAMTRLSTGLRINSAKDDAAGLAIANRMESQIRGVSQAIRNANDGISLAQTAEGALGEVTNILQRMRELAVQSANSINSNSDRQSLDLEVQQLKTELDRIGSTTSFNNQKLLDGSFKNKNLQIGASAGQSISLSIGSVKTNSLGMGQASFGGDVVVSGRAALGGAIQAGDIMINGQSLTDIEASDDIGRVVEKINLSIDNVKASAFNVVQADTKGNGVAADGDIVVTVKAIGAGTDTAFTLGKSTSMDELVDNINAAAGVLVKASLSDDGKLVLSNDTGASIEVADGTNGIATGFVADAGAPNAFTGFIKLESTDGSSVTVERGNLGLNETGSLDDLEKLGFREVVRSTEGDAYTLVGKALTATGAMTAWDKTELTINGVEIYDENIDTASLEGKLAAINSMSEKTGVVASAQYERVINTDGMEFVQGDTVILNGKAIAVGVSGAPASAGVQATAATLVANINAATKETGLTAELNGQNIILRGENVKQVNWETKAYSMTSAFDAVPVAGADSATQRTLTLSTADLQAGREFTIEFSVTAGAKTASFTISDDATYTARVQALRSDIISYFVSEGAAFGAQVADGTGTTTSPADFSATGVQPFDWVTATGQVITFAASANLGVMNLRFKSYSSSDMQSYVSTSVSATGAVDTTYGKIKLDSLNNSPISVNTGQAADVARHGLLETNVGAADYDVNEATMGTSGGSTVAGLNVASESNAVNSLSTIDNALTKVSDIRSNLGAVMNRLESTVNNLTNTVINTTDAKSRIFDADYSSETTRLTKAQVIQQAATAMLAQANQAPQQVLSLLK